MAGNLWGADVAQLRMLAQNFGKTSETLLQQSTSLTSAINNNTSWKGADGARFKSEWNSNHRTQILQTAHALKEQSKRLMTQADEQEKASNAAPGAGGGPGVPGSPGSPGNWALLGGAAGVGILRNFMGVQKNVKAPLTLAKHLGQYGWVWKNRRTEFVKSMLTRGRHRLGGPGFDTRHLWQNTQGNKTLEGLLKESTKNSRTLKLIDQASDVASLKNLQDIKGPLDKFLGPLNKVASLTAERSLVGAGTKYEWLGKAGLARGLGWAGVGFSAYDSVQSFANGDIEGGLGSAFKAGLGVGSFLPPPAGTVCQVASVGIAVYENWDTISRVGKDVGEGIVNAVKDPGKFVSDTASNIKDAGESVAKFFSFGD